MARSAPADGLVLALGFEDGAGQMARDASGRRWAASPAVISRTPSSRAVGEWTSLAFTFDGELLRLHVDGVLVGERYRRTALVHSAGPLRICGNSFWGHFLDGFVDELRVYEPGLAGVAFRLRTSDGTLLASTVSDANGTYHFSNVPAGTYLVETTQPSGLSLTPPDRGSDDTLDSDFTGPTHRTPDIAFLANGSISNLDAGFEVFLD